MSECIFVCFSLGWRLTLKPIQPFAEIQDGGFPPFGIFLYYNVTYLLILVIVFVHIESLPRRRCFIVLVDNVLVDEHVSNKRLIALCIAPAQ